MAKKKSSSKKTAAGSKVTPFPTDAQLRKAVEGSHPEIAPAAALRSLSYRSASKIGETMLKVAKDKKQQVPLRTTAAVHLGREASPANRRALAALLESEEPAVVRRAAEGLGRIGDASALKKLRALRPRQAVVKRAVDTAKTLLSYRLGEKSGRLAVPEARSVLSLGKAKAHEFEIEAVPAAELKAMASTLAKELPQVPVASSGAITMDCGRGNYLVVFNKDLAKKEGLGRLTETSNIMGAVLKRADVDGVYYVDTYLLTHPGAGKTARLFAMKGSGVVTYYGTLVQDEEGVQFALNALNTRYSQPVDLAGRIQTRTLAVTFSRSKVAAARSAEQLPPNRPRSMTAQPR